MFHLSSVLALAALQSLYAPGVGGVTLEDVFRNRTGSSTFNWLVRTHPEIFSNLTIDRANGVTILAPTNQAFEKAGSSWSGLGEARVRPTLEYHILKRAIHTDSITRGQHVVVPTRLTLNVTGGQPVILTKNPSGDCVFTSGFATRGTVVQENIGFDDGFVQIIDSVMRVPEPFESTAHNAYTDLSAFLGALHATGLINEVNAARDITIFAPHNDAFRQLFPVFEKMSLEELRRVIRYHLVFGSVYHSWEFVNGTSLVTAGGLNGTSRTAGSGPSGGTISITRYNNYIYANSAQFLQTDILISNGVVQMIDNCLNPSAPNARPNVGLPKQPPVLSTERPSQTSRTPTPQRDTPKPTVADTQPKASEPAKDVATPAYGGVSALVLCLSIVAAIIAL